MLSTYFISGPTSRVHYFISGPTSRVFGRLFFSLTTSEPRQLLVMFLPPKGELEVWRQGATFEDSARELAAKKLPRARLSLRMSWRTVWY